MCDLTIIQNNCELIDEAVNYFMEYLLNTI